MLLALGREQLGQQVVVIGSSAQPSTAWEAFPPWSQAAVLLGRFLQLLQALQEGLSVGRSTAGCLAPPLLTVPQAWVSPALLLLVLKQPAVGSVAAAAVPPTSQPAGAAHAA
jgi:hypothetical protein